MLLIGFGHKARQGKNTAALAVLNACPIDSFARMYAYADALRKEVERACRQVKGARNLIEQFQEAGIMPEWVHAEPTGEKQRTLLQWWGTDYRRAQDPDYWVKRLFETFAKEKPTHALVTDVRFPNETAAIKAAGGYLVKVVRTSPPDVVVPEHESERALDGYAGWDYTLTAAAEAELKRKAAELYAKIVREHDAKRG